MEKTRAYIAEHYPYYSALLAHFNIRWDKRIPTAGVKFNNHGGIDCVINKDFFYGMSEEKRIGLMLHEILHVSMKHLTRGKNLNKKIANIAMDMAINQYIPPNLLPDQAILPQHFKLPLNKSFETYYIDLMKNHAEEVETMGTLDEHGWGDEEKQGQGQFSEEIKESIVNDMLEKAAAEAGGKKAGNIPKACQDILDGIRKRKGRINWRREIRQFIGRKYSAETEPTRTRPNRRQGFFAPGQKRLDAPYIDVFIDESGSVSDEQVKVMLHEVKWMFECIKDNVDVSFFDTQIHKTLKLSQIKGDIPRYACGGTSFQCCIDKAKASHANLVIIFTDGEAQAPENIKAPILWVLFNGAQGHNLPGKKVYIQE